MAAFIKTKLKTARDLIGKKDFVKALAAAEEVLSYEPDNYNANVFIGLAYLELRDYEQSEQAFRKAIDSNPSQPLAWQGVSKYYLEVKKWDKYVETLRAMMDLFAKGGDAVKCAETLQKFIEFKRERGTRKEVGEALSLLLPGSSYYSILSSLPPPDPTAPTASTIIATRTAIHNSLPIIEEIVATTEKEEEDILEKEVNKRRMRLNSAGPEELRKEVGLEVWSASKLSELYNEVINHPSTSDDLRRSTESKLLRFKYRLQCALPSSGDLATVKAKVGKEVQALIDGVVLLNIPDEFGWTLFIEGKNTDSIEGYDFKVLRQFIVLFPGSSLTQLFRGYFLYHNLSLEDEPDDEDEENEREAPEEGDDADPFDIVLEATSLLPHSILAHRILGDIYIVEEDYKNAIASGEKGLELVRRHEANTGKRLSQVMKAFNITLATGLVHLFPPKHHQRALRVLDEVLSFEPHNIPCLMGRGYILQAAGKWEYAADLFGKVVEHLLDDVDTGLIAKEERAWCVAQAGDLQSAAQELQDVLDKLETLEGYELRKARVWWRLGRCYWLMGENREKSYRYFITSLKRSPDFAPAFTSLGIYYLECASPPDPTRATKCFQKAFELDARETDSARRLANSFANEREWDLVEVVARRTIEGEGGLGGGLADAEATAKAKHKPTNAWAWKALGVVELNQRNYAAAIQAFQVALRSDEKDALSWLRLGEAYTKAGRHAAALKALVKSHELQPEDWMCMYQIGEVQRQTGQLPQAIATFSSVLDAKPDETVVLLSLSETQLALGHTELATGYLGRASASFLTSISTSLSLITSSPGFRRLAWKTIADALFALADFSSFVDEGLALDVLGIVASLVSGRTDEKIRDIVKNVPVSESTALNGLLALQLGVLTCSYRISLFSKGEDGVSNAHFDLGVALHRLSTSSISEGVREKARSHALENVRQALTNDPGDPLFWTTFGNLNFISNPMVAQHAYIRALEIDNKDARVWTNLGLLYLHNEDPALANEAFLKAQTLDPDYTLAWVGQGLVATANGHEQDAIALFEHSIGLTADLPEADFEYSYRMFRELSHVQNHPSSSSKELLLPPFFSLDRYCRRRPDDPSALHLFALVCERLHHEDLAIRMISRAIKLLEVIYEESEDANVERQYAIANTNLGRLHIVTGRYNEATETFDAAFGLLPEGGDEETVALRAMCRFGSGIAQVRLGNLEEALAIFEAAQEIADADTTIRGQVTVLLAQTLWAIGTDEFKESAKEQLLACISNDPDNLAAVAALAGMGLLTNDETLIDAAVSEILASPMDERRARDPGRDVEHLLVSHYLAEENIQKASSVTQQSVHSEPSRLEARQELASLTISLGRPEMAQALLSKSLQTSPSQSKAHSLRILAIALASKHESGESFSVAEARIMAQRAIVLAPWESKNWLSLAYVQNND